MRRPVVTFHLAPFAVLAGLGLRMLRIFERVRAIGNPYLIDVESVLPSLAEMQDALMRTAPIFSEVGFVFVVPYEPPTTFEKLRNRHFHIGENFRKAADVKRPV